MALDHKALIEFNKFTLALAAASFTYAFEKLLPAEGSGARLLILAVLILLFASAFCAVLLFALATAAQHRTEAKAKELDGLIEMLGTAHAIFLAMGLLVLGGLLTPRIFADPVPKPTGCCSDQRTLP
jgi:hypothetical protein